MIARALVALGGASLTAADLADDKLSECETVTLTGEGTTWPEAKIAAAVPADARVMYWMRDG